MDTTRRPSLADPRAHGFLTRDENRLRFRSIMDEGKVLLIKIGAKIVRHGRYVTFQMAEVAVPRELFRKILSLIDDLRGRPVPA